MQNHEEFETIYFRYSDKIFRFLYFRTKDTCLAEDITGEVFVRAWKNWNKIENNYVQAWLYKIASNLLIDHFRKEKNKKSFSLEVAIKIGKEPSYDEDMVGKIQKDGEIAKIHKALDSLPENLREVAILRFIEDMPAKEVSDILKITEINVRVLQHRALVKLKEMFKNGK